MKRVLLCVDISYQTYRAAASRKELTANDGTFTGGLYGFLMTLAKQIRETQATAVIACLDSKPYRRSLLYPDYKLLRKKNADEDLLKLYKESEPLVREALVEIGIPAMSSPGFESDDCIGWIVQQHRHRWDLIYAASNDSDLYQLLDCPWFKILTNEVATAMDSRRLFREHGITPDQYMLATALTGTHNDIAGIDRVGPVTALKAVRDASLMRSMRERHSEVIDRNLQLIKLPHPEFSYGPLPKMMRSFDERAFYRWCSRFDIEVTKSMTDSFQQIAP